MKRLAVFCCLLAASLAFAEARDNQRFNFGAKMGFSSTICYVEQLQIAGQPVTTFDAQSEVSTNYTAFGRFNIKRHYIQPEISYARCRYSVVFDAREWNETAPADAKNSISTLMSFVEVPLLYGYHLSQDGPYGFSIFGGPKLSMLVPSQSRHTFDGFDYRSIDETVRPLQVGGVVGIGTNISCVFFDFRYEFGLHNISQGFTTLDGDCNHSEDDIRFDRRRNALSFSIGLLF